MKDLVPNGKEDAFSRIAKFMSNDESGVVLTAKEEQILARWIYANGLLKERKYKTDFIVDKIVERFSVSRYTAMNDIANTRSLFVKLVKDLKKYALIHHIEDIQLRITQWSADKSLSAHLPKLYDSLTKALAALPDEVVAPNVATPVVVFNVVPGQAVQSGMSADEAMKAADELIELEKNHEYTDFEDLSHEPNT